MRESASGGKVDKIRAEAWLFDARVWREGKPTSFRLEVYRTDSVTALSGRGYLGKGAMKGTIRDDRLYVYFPRTNEYLDESAGSLLDAMGCSDLSPRVDILALLTDVPDSVDGLENVQVTASYLDSEQPSFVMYSRGCPWQLDLKYDRRKVGWRLKAFEFNSGDGVRLKVKRRTLKPRARVPAKRFQTTHSPDARRISY
ncbi:MAG: hypothetical protein KOO62_07275 [candidate division Zixibacteria bacterium]|nr:hypothetical protein [candidate division Zixibacteria bacterium]